MDQTQEKTSESNILIQEYAAIIQKANSNEAWACNFVALYFAFIASVATATGYLYFQKTVDISRSLNSSDHISWPSELLIVLPLLGLCLNFWAIFMVVDYKRTAKILFLRLAEIEQEIHDSDAGVRCFATQLIAINDSTAWKYGSVIIVGAVMLLFFAPWVLILLESL